ncbi:MAG: hypothetical protein DRP59_11870 [Spirochaetes bacterium]|nr:MAG: hypothetical protein DRP59_11870 [Spirochaetota bacterium]
MVSFLKNSADKRNMTDLKKFLLLLLAIIPLYLSAQSSSSTGSGTMDIPGHFNKIYLGMTLDQVKQALAEDSNFYYTGDPDLSILQRPNETLLECSGTFYIERAFFQFYQEKLYTITLVLSPDDVDHFSVYTELAGKYGDPQELDPHKSVWSSDSYLLSLERPLTVKYMDRKMLDGIRTSGQTKKTLQELSRKQFLDQF